MKYKAKGHADKPLHILIMPVYILGRPNSQLTSAQIYTGNFFYFCYSPLPNSWQNQKSERERLFYILLSHSVATERQVRKQVTEH